MMLDHHPLHPPPQISDDDMETLTLTSHHHHHHHLWPPPLHSPSPPSSPHFLDPPSYADAVFSPASPLPTTSLSSHHRLHLPSYQISVQDPQKQLDSTSSSLVTNGTFVSYLVVTRVSPNQQFKVRRRFRDVVALADRLAETYKGFFVPPRPDKSVVEGQFMYKNEFVEQRRAAIEKYLQRLAGHPVIGRSDCLRSFLEESVFSVGPGVGSRVLDGEGVGNAGGGGQVDGALVARGGGKGFLSMFWDLKPSVVTEWVATKPAVLEEDVGFLEAKKKLQDLEQQLTTASQQAESLVKAQQDISVVMGDLGLTLIEISKFETEQAIHQSQRIRAADVKNFATAAVKASRLYRELNSHSVKNLDILHEYLGLMLAAHTAFSDRSSALSAVQNIMSDLSTLYAKEEKYEQTRVLKEELRETIRKKEEAKNTATLEYERIKENNKYELDRLERERQEDFLAMLKGFVVSQVGYAEKIASVWTDVAEETNGYVREK